MPISVQPIELSDADVAFSTEVMHLLPPWDDETKKFWNGNSKYERFFSVWFYAGIERKHIDALEPVEGIDKRMALRHISACMGSFEPSHEHKTGGVARLLSEWFGDSVPDLRGDNNG